MGCCERLLDGEQEGVLPSGEGVGKDRPGKGLCRIAESRFVASGLEESLAAGLGGALPAGGQRGEGFDVSCVLHPARGVD